MPYKRSGRSIIFPVIMSAFGWTVHQGCSNLFGASTCAKAPPALEVWSATSRTVESVRAPDDRANFEAFLTKHPNALNKRYGYGCETPLHSAARLDRGDIAPLLIERGADLRALDRNGDTPIHTAAKYVNPTLVKLLLAAGADANVEARSGSTPLLSAVLAGAGAIDPARRRAVVEALLVGGADVNAKQSKSGFTPLRDATLRDSQDEQMIELLLKHGADVRAIDDQGEPLFVTAVSSASVVTVRRLLDRGADVNAASKFCTALASAAGAGNVEVVALLMERGADVNRRIPGSPLSWEGLPLAATLYVGKGIDKERVPRKREAALALIRHGADVNARNESGETMLHFVVGEGNIPAIDLLLSHGAAVSAPDKAGFTPLHRAVEHGHLEAATRLVSAGADTRAATTDGSTPLSLASSDREMAALIRRHAN